MFLSILLIFILSCSAFGQNVASLEPTASEKKSFGTGSLNAIRKGWYTAAVIHKPCAKTFHIGNPFPLYQENMEKFQEEQL